MTTYEQLLDELEQVADDPDKVDGLIKAASDGDKLRLLARHFDIHDAQLELIGIHPDGSVRTDLLRMAQRLDDLDAFNQALGTERVN